MPASFIMRLQNFTPKNVIYQQRDHAALINHRIIWDQSGINIQPEGTFQLASFSLINKQSAGTSFMDSC